MALRVWLPLNGSLENQGISGIVPTMMGSVPLTETGKIGKCAYFFNNPANCVYMDGLQQINNFSWTCWFKCVGEGSAAYQFLLSEGRDCVQYGVNLRLTKEGTGLFAEVGANSAVVRTSTKTIELNKWYHAAMTVSSTELKLYVDGELFNTKTLTLIPNYEQSNNKFVIGKMAHGYTGTGSYFPFNGYVNDVRIYDHCLSPLEVKEISQGLVLHYKLNSQYGLGLVNKYSDEYSIGKGNSYSNGYTVTKNNDGDGYNYSFSYTGTGSDSWPYIHFPNFTFTAGKTYIWQLKVRVNSCSNYALNARQSRMDNDWERSFGQVVNTSLVGKGWKEYYVLQVLNEKSTRSGTEYTTNPCLELYPPSLKAEGTVYTANFDIKDVMICETDHYIPFIDNNLECNYIVDSSGYGNNGTATGAFSAESDSNRYEISTKSLNGTDCIKSPLSLVDVQSFTCSFWVKPSSSNGGYSIVASNYNNPSSGFWISTNCEGHALWFYNQAYADTTTANISNDVWHHCVIVCDNKTFSMYIDGIQQTLNRTTSSSKTITVNNLSVFNSYTGTSWNTKRYGNISDFRFYISALSSEDILDLYHTPANIDNLQNIHTFELKDNENTSQILKNGVMATREFHESNSELLNSFSSGGYAPAKNTNNSCVNMGIADFSDYADLNKDLSIHIECDIEWTAFTADTGGTFKGIWWQGSNYKKETSAYAWEGANYVCSILNSTKSLQNVTTVASPGKYHYDVTTTIPASWFNTYSKSNIGFRCDYSDGTGRIDVTNFKITPSQYYNAKIGKDFISANNFIEK